MEVAGEAAEWPTTLVQASNSRTDMLLVDWDLLPEASTAALEQLRKVCPAWRCVIVLISHLEARQQAALSAGRRMRLSVKVKCLKRVAEHLRNAAA